jgi:hypothetical protein
MASIRFYQIGKSQGEIVDTFNVQYAIGDGTTLSEFDSEKFAAMTANKLLRLRTWCERLEKVGKRMSFSPSKALYFEYNNGEQVVKCNDFLARQIGFFIKAKSGKKLPTKTEMKEIILCALGVMAEFATLDTDE